MHLCVTVSEYMKRHQSCAHFLAILLWLIIDIYEFSAVQLWSMMWDDEGNIIIWTTDTYCLITMLFAICIIQNNSGVCLFLVREKLRNMLSSPLSYHHSPISRHDLAPQTQSSCFGAYVQRHLGTTRHSWQQQAGIYFHCSWGSISSLLALCSAGHQLNDQISHWNHVVLFLYAGSIHHDTYPYWTSWHALAYCQISDKKSTGSCLEYLSEH